MTETQKAISPMQELINWIDVFGFGEAQEVTRRVIRLKATQLLEEESKALEEKDKEIERLKGLIREGFSLLQTAWGKTEEQKWNDWEKFKTENQL